MAVQLTTRDLTSGDLDAAFDVRCRSFGPLDHSMRAWWNGVQQESINEGGSGLGDLRANEPHSP